MEMLRITTDLINWAGCYWMFHAHALGACMPGLLVCRLDIQLAEVLLDGIARGHGKHS